MMYPQPLKIYTVICRHSKIEIQLSLLPDMLKTGNNDHGMGMKKVTMVSSVCELFETCQFPKTMLEEVHKVLLLYLTIFLCHPQPLKIYTVICRHSKIEIQLSLLPDMLKTGNNDHGMGMKKVTMVSSVCELFETCQFPKTMLEEVHKVFTINHDTETVKPCRAIEHT